MENGDISQFKSRDCEHFTDENDSLIKFIAPATMLLVSLHNMFYRIISYAKRYNNEQLYVSSFFMLTCYQIHTYMNR